MAAMESTLGMSREKWLTKRKKGIGGSDAGAICGLNPYASPLSVYLDKTTEEISSCDNEAMRQGKRIGRLCRQTVCGKYGNESPALQCHVSKSRVPIYDC